MRETTAIRRVAYALFFGCSLGLVFTLYMSIAPWAGFLAGTLTFGAMSAWLLVRDLDRREIEQARAQHRGGRWRDDDEDEAAA